MKTHPPAQVLGFFDVEVRVPWLEAKGNPLSRLAEWVETTDGAVYADAYTECRGAEAEAILARKQPRKLSRELQTELQPLTQLRKAVFGVAQTFETKGTTAHVGIDDSG